MLPYPHEGTHELSIVVVVPLGIEVANPLVKDREEVFFGVPELIRKTVVDEDHVVFVKKDAD